MSSRSLPAWILAFALLVLIAVIGIPRLIAARAEAGARTAWSATMPFEALARPRESREANAAALRLEQAAAVAGLAIAPRQSGRAAALDAPAPVATLHADLSRLLAGEPASALEPALREWLSAHAPTLDALAVDVAGSEPPRWESPTGPAIARSPLPLERSDRLIAEAARLASVAELDDADAHLTRPGTPRLDGVALLEETMLLAAVVEGRGGDMQRALRFVAASVRIEEGLVGDADLVTLGVVTNLARLRLAVLRDLAPPIDVAPYLGPDLEVRYRDAVLVEAGELARALAPRGERDQGLSAKAGSFLFAAQGRAARASTLAALQAIAQAAGPVRIPNDELPALEARMRESAPAWDSLQGRYLADIVALLARIRRERVDAELTRRLAATRLLMLTTGSAGDACRQIAEPPSDDPPATFTCSTNANGALSLVATTTIPLLGRPSAAELPFEAVLLPAR